MTYSISRSALKLSAAVALGLTLTMCEKSKDTSTETSAPEEKQVDPKLLEAQKVIEDDPNVKFIRVVDDKIEFRNIYTDIGMILPYQDIIDGKYDAIKGGKAAASKVLIPKEKESIATGDGDDYKGWGKTPDWIPRYPDLVISPGKIHGTRKDGSVWGQISGSHRDSIEKMREQLIAGFQKSDMVLASELPGDASLSLIFENPPSDNDDESTVKRRVGCSLRHSNGTTFLDMQYTYGY
ncbi:hypothetical protein [Oceaniferula spumae]